MDIKPKIRLFVKLLFFATVLIIPLIFYVNVKHHYEFPKTMTARALMIPATVLFFFCFAGRFWTTKNPYRLPFLLLIGAATLSALKSVNLCETLDAKYLLDIYLYLLVCHFVIAARFTEKDIHFVIVLLVIAGMLSGIYGVIQYFERESEILVGPLKALAVRGERPEPVAFQGNRNYSSEFYNFALPMAIVLFFISRRWVSRLGLLFCIFFIRYHFIIADTRASEVALTVTLPVVLLILFWIRRESGLGCFSF